MTDTPVLDPAAGIASPVTGLVVVHTTAKQGQIEIDSAYNPRWDLGDLRLFGKAIDEEGQTTPLIVVPTGKKRTPVSVRDGYRRVTAAAKGFTKCKEWIVHVLMMPDGTAPPEERVRRHCMITNIARKEYSPVEKAQYCALEIDAAIDKAQQEYNADREEPAELPAKIRQHVRAQKVRELAAMFGESDRNIRHSLPILNLPKVVQTALHEGRLPAHASTFFHHIPAEDAPAILARAEELFKEKIKEKEKREEAADMPGQVIQIGDQKKAGSGKGTRSAPAKSLVPVPRRKAASAKNVKQAIGELGSKRKDHGDPPTKKAVTLKISELEMVDDETPMEHTLSELTAIMAQVLRWREGLRPTFPDLTKS